MHKSTTGYTLVELLATLTISSILLGIGLPNFASMLSSSRLTGQVNDLSASLALARSESAKRNHQVIICKSRDQKNCNKQSPWHEGWIIYVDANLDRKRNSDEPVVYTRQGFKNGTELNYRGFGSVHYIVYHPTGFTRTNGTFTFCDPKLPELKRALILMKTGRVRFSRTKSTGEPLDCG